MEPMIFTAEEMVPNFLIKGEAKIYEGPYPPPGDTMDPTDGTRNISTKQKWWVHVKWTTSGKMNYIMCGNFYLQVFLEEMGVGEFKLMDHPIAVPLVCEPHTYLKDIVFDPEHVPAGLYKVTLALTMKGSCGVPAPIAAVAEGPVVQFYDHV